MTTNWREQVPHGKQEHSNPTLVKRRPNAIPLKTHEEPNTPLYHPQEDSLSPRIEYSPKMTYINIKLNGKLSAQNKTRSTEDRLDYETGTKEKNVKRSNSARVPIHKLKPEFLQSPNYEEGRAPKIGELSNQNPGFSPQPSNQGNIPIGNYGYDGPMRDPRYHRISEESNESGIYTNSEKSTGLDVKIFANESDSETIVDQSSSNEVSNTTTGAEHRNVHEYPVEETIRPKYEKPEEPIYVNYPLSPDMIPSQSDSYLTDRVLKLSSVLEKMGGVGKLESLFDQLREKDGRIYQLERMNEKLDRDNGILQDGLAFEKQNAVAQHNKIKDLTDKNNQLMMPERYMGHNYHATPPVNSQSNRYIPPHKQQEAYPNMHMPRYTSVPNENIPIAQNRYENSDPYAGRRDPRRDSAPDLDNLTYFPPRNISQSEYANTQYYPPLDAIHNFTPCFTSNSESRPLPRSTPPGGGMNAMANIPLNFGYPATHIPESRRKC